MSRSSKKIKKLPKENVKCQASERATSVKRGPHWHYFRFLESSSGPTGRPGLTQRLSDTLAASPRLRSLRLALAEAETSSDPAAPPSFTAYCRRDDPVQPRGRRGGARPDPGRRGLHLRSHISRALPGNTPASVAYPNRRQAVRASLRSSARCTTDSQFACQDPANDLPMVDPVLRNVSSVRINLGFL